MRWHRLLLGGIRKSKLFLKTGKELAVLRSNGKLFQTTVGQLPKNDVCLTQCYKMVQKENVVSTVDDRREREDSYRSKVTAK